MRRRIYNDNKIRIRDLENEFGLAAKHIRKIARKEVGLKRNKPGLGWRRGEEWTFERDSPELEKLITAIRKRTRF